MANLREAQEQMKRRLHRIGERNGDCVILARESRRRYLVRCERVRRDGSICGTEYVKDISALRRVEACRACGYDKRRKHPPKPPRLTLVKAPPAPEAAPVVKVAPEGEQTPPIEVSCNGLCRKEGALLAVSPQCPKHYGYGVPDKPDGRDKPGKSSLAEAREWSEI